MALWEYKVITSGLHGFASPSLLEAHLNALGKDEWEIINFQTLPNNPLAFNGLARRTTTRDWAPPEAVVVTAPKPMAWDQPPSHAPASKSAPVVEEKPELAPALVEAEAPKSKVEDTKLRTVRDTERDLDPDAPEEEEDWDKWEESQEELPTFFEAIKPHLRRNQRGPGMSVALDYLAKRWDQKESDIAGALKECGFTLPETEEADPDYFEFEGDLYWVNRNNRGQFFLNTREKPRPTFRIAPVTKLDPNDPAAAELVAERAAEKAEIEKRNTERTERVAAQAAAAAAKAAARELAQVAARERSLAATAEAGAAAVSEAAAEGAPVPSVDAASTSGPVEPLPTGSALLDKIRPLMRRNRRGPGYSGSVVFLARALKLSEADFVVALAGLNLNVPASHSDKPVYVEIDGGEYWVNKDSRGGIWINGQEKRGGTSKSATPAEASAETPSAETSTVTEISPEGSVVIESSVDAPAVAPAISSESGADVSPVPMAEAIQNNESPSEQPKGEKVVPSDPDAVSSEPVGSIDSMTAEESDDDEPEQNAAAAGTDDKPAKAAKKSSRPRAPRRPKKTKE